jgi:CRP/FNR family transcriptional regulator, cyclic AMP receptor protein
MQSQNTPSLDALPKVVTGNRWFATLSGPQQTALIRASRSVVLRDGQLAMTQGQSVRKRRDGLMLLVDGSLKVASTSAAGREAILTLIHPGQWFGELSVLDGSSRERDVRSMGVSEVLIIEPEALAELMKDASFTRHLVELLSARTRMLLGLVEDFSMRSARARTARRLVLLAHQDDTRSTQPRKDVIISHDALSSMLGMTRQTLAQQLKVLSEVGAIVQGYGRIVILSMVLLMAEASGT